MMQVASMGLYVAGEGEGQTGDVGLDLDLADASASSLSQGAAKDGPPGLAIAGKQPS